jgi:hypothetical protein
MKYEEEDIIDFCRECKEEILARQGFVYKDGKYYHLECYHLLIDVPLEVESNVEENIE